MSEDSRVIIHLISAMAVLAATAYVFSQVTLEPYGCPSAPPYTVHAPEGAVPQEA